MRRALVLAQPLWNSNSYASSLQWCVNRKALPEGKLVHAHLIVSGFQADEFLGTKLVVMYAKCRSLVDARRALNQMSEGNAVAWTAMITAYVTHGLHEEALTLFYQMQRTGIGPDQFTYAGVLPACASLAALERGKEVHEDIIRRGFESDIFVGSALVDVYFKCGRVEDARHVFDKMSERDVVSWNAMIAGYAQNGRVEEALKLFHKMPGRDLVSWNAMIAAFAQNGRVEEVEEFFHKMPERNVVSWTAMVAGYAQVGNVDKALELFWKMPERNMYSWTAMITAFAQNRYVEEALELFQRMPERNRVSWNAVAAGYALNGYVEEAVEIFQKMPEPDVVSWNTMIAAYTQNGYFVEALKFFGQMRLAGVKSNPVAFSGVLPACASLAAMECGKAVHADIIRNGLGFDVYVGNALVDMYAKCGSIEDACKVFDKMPERNAVSWTAIIVGHAMHGSAKEALQLFEQMQQCGMKPDHVTFIGVLSACCHAGLVDDGWGYFYCMSRDHGLTPAVEHYSCMVDLLGRAGHLDEAQAFVNKMPIKPNAAVWESLLGACRIHANIEVGKFVAERLLELEPRRATHYVLLSNVYAMAGRWEDAEKVRKMMKDRKVKKMPGCTWIEVNNRMHSFCTGDRSHPQTQKIYAKLETLSGQMKEAGYFPDTDFVLHDVEEEQKDHILCHHSEKLALAFGLINTSPGMPIRIVKNLRVCGDCHSATKFISKIVARQIIVRDANRFHCFKDGQCSCGDYW